MNSTPSSATRRRRSDPGPRRPKETQPGPWLYATAKETFERCLFVVNSSDMSVQPGRVLERMESGKPPAIIDVRTAWEFRAGHIAGAIHAPIQDIVRGSARLPARKSAELVVTCEHGPRAKIAKGVLGLLGYRRVSLLQGHMLGWRQGALPLERQASASTGPEMSATAYRAPDRQVLLSSGETTRLNSFWQDKPVALVFLRHFGCPFARRQAVELSRERDGLRKAGIDVVLVGCGSPENAETFRRDYKVPFPIVCDPNGVLFRKYGLGDMDLRDILSPAILLQVVTVLAEGYGHTSGQGPERQLGGVFVVDRAGKVRFAHRAADATYIADPQELIRAAATLREKAAPKRARPRVSAARPAR